MKRLSIQIIALIASVLFQQTLKAQDYQISFTGSGVSTSVESVLVENITQGTSLTLTGQDILNLKGLATAISTNEFSNGELKVYPNPVKDNGNIEFIAKANGSCTIDIYSISGKKVISSQYNLNKGTHLFRFGGLSTGIYTLSIKADGYFYTAKLISKGTDNGGTQLTYSGYQEERTSLKSGVNTNMIQMDYNDGDRLIITASWVYIAP